MNEGSSAVLLRKTGLILHVSKKHPLIKNIKKLVLCIYKNKNIT